jgi:hypothetical protein
MNKEEEEEIVLSVHWNFPKIGKMKKHSFALCKYVNHLKHINANKHFVLLSVFKCNSLAKCYIICNLLKKCIENEIFPSTKISHCVAKR